MKRAFGGFYKFDLHDHECKILLNLWPLNFITFIIDNISSSKRIVDTDIVYDVRAKVLLHVWSYEFYDKTLSTE